MTRSFRLAALALVAAVGLAACGSSSSGSSSTATTSTTAEQARASSPRAGVRRRHVHGLARHLPRRRQGPRPVPLGRRPRLQERLQRRLRDRLAAADHDAACRRPAARPSRRCWARPPAPTARTRSPTPATRSTTSPATAAPARPTARAATASARRGGSSRRAAQDGDPRTTSRHRPCDSSGRGPRLCSTAASRSPSPRSGRSVARHVAPVAPRVVAGERQRGERAHRVGPRREHAGRPRRPTRSGACACSGRGCARARRCAARGPSPVESCSWCTATAAGT